jgi:hypothetical protein
MFSCRAAIRLVVTPSAMLTIGVERLLPIGGGREIIGVAYPIKVDELKQAECAIVIPDKWQGLGVGTKLLSDLLEIGARKA